MYPSRDGRTDADGGTRFTNQLPVSNCEGVRDKSDAGNRELYFRIGTVEGKVANLNINGSANLPLKMTAFLL